MAEGHTAEVRVSFSALKDAFDFVLGASFSTRALVTLSSSLDGLYLARAESGTRLAATGTWPGTATFPGRLIRTNLAHSKIDGDEVTLKVIGSRLHIGEFVVDCEWMNETDAFLSHMKKRSRRRE